MKKDAEPRPLAQTPAKGQSRTVPGQRPFRDAAQVLLLQSKEPCGSVGGFLGEAASLLAQRSNCQCQQPADWCRLPLVSKYSFENDSERLQVYTPRGEDSRSGRRVVKEAFDPAVQYYLGSVKSTLVLEWRKEDI